ncbi:hypothetical protein LWI29_026805 [Acer saccharum]|uniref:Uncharacterized protein n=1 Tax=Acer saccharum TaxID=4024 RepID=A0AA39VGS6_ACESA|nr:hypothetical protein LWI29_026805 [Acer saccharum]
MNLTGRIGHGTKECPDDNARAEALRGETPKFGAWMRALVPERSRGRFQSLQSGSSTDKEKSLEGSCDVGLEGSPTFKIGSLESHKGESIATVAAMRKTTEVAQSKTLTVSSGSGPPRGEGLRVDGPLDLPVGNLEDKACGKNKAHSKSKVDICEENAAVPNPYLTCDFPLSVAKLPQIKLQIQIKIKIRVCKITRPETRGVLRREVRDGQRCGDSSNNDGDVCDGEMCSMARGTRWLEVSDGHRSATARCVRRLEVPRRW